MARLPVAPDTGRMPSDMQHRLGLAIFAALAFASATGFTLMPAFDPVAWLRPQLGTAGAGALLVALAAAGSQLTLRQLGRRGHPRLARGSLRAVVWLAWGVSAAAWLLAELARHGADGRALLWLALSPAWLAAAGLWGRSAGGASGESPRHSGGFRPTPDGTPYGGPRRGVMDQIDMGRGLDVQRPGTGKERIRRREDDVVAMAPEAEEQLAA
jgi:hypothetical protein